MNNNDSNIEASSSAAPHNRVASEYFTDIVAHDTLEDAQYAHRSSIAMMGPPADLIFQTDTLPPLNIATAGRRGSLDIPPYYERARHSTELTIRHRDSIAPVPSFRVAEQASKHAIEVDEHRMSIQEVARKYDLQFDETSEQVQGLTELVAKQHFDKFGPNSLKPPKKESLIVKFLKQFTQLFSLMLLLAAVLSFITAGIVGTNAENYILAGALVCSFYWVTSKVIVAILNAFISFLEEYKSEKILEGFQNLIATKARVFRGGQLKEVSASAIVPGDVVQIKYVVMQFSDNQF